MTGQQQRVDPSIGKGRRLPAEGWEHTKFGHAFHSSRTKGKAGLPTLSVTLTDGLVPRDSIDRKMETNLTAEEHLLVKRGDIAYNMMRMWQGASGLAPHDALVSPAYVVLRAKNNIDPHFAAYLFKLARMVHLFWAYSYGITDDRLRLYFKDFGAIPVSLPPLPEQRKIAEILSTWDRAIAAQERLIANARAQKKALMQTLLPTGAHPPKKRLPGFSGDWVSRVFGAIAESEKRRIDPKSLTSVTKCVELEHIESETGALLGFCDARAQASLKSVFEPGYVLYGKLRPYLRKFYRPDFSGVCSTEIWSIKANLKSCLPDFLYYLIQSPTFEEAVDISSGSKMPRADWGIVKGTTFRLPKLNEQRAICDVLDAAEAELSYSERQLALLRHEKSALMQQLLTGKRRVKAVEVAA